MEWSGKVIQEKQGQLLDSWNQPFEYSIQNNNYVLTSFGRDGKPGGIGLDCDLTNLQPKPPQSQLTLSQFASLPTAHYVRNPSLVIGLLVTVVLLVTSVQSTKQSTKIRLREFMVATLFIILFAGVFSGFISLEEIPSH